MVALNIIVYCYSSELGDPLRAHAFLDKALEMKADNTKVGNAFTFQLINVIRVKIDKN